MKQFNKLWYLHHWFLIVSGGGGVAHQKTKSLHRKWIPDLFRPHETLWGILNLAYKGYVVIHQKYIFDSNSTTGWKRHMAHLDADGAANMSIRSGSF